MKLEDLKEKEARLEKKLEKVRREIESATHEDGWYIVENQNSFTEKLIMYAVDGLLKFGVDEDGDWIEFKEGRKLAPILRLATEEKYTKRLTEFVKSLGYDEGVKVNDCRGYGEFAIGMQSLEFLNDYDSTDFCILFGGCCVWSSNKGWAEIIEKKPKYTVESVSKSNLKHVYNFAFRCSKHVDAEDLSKKIENFLNSEV